MEQQRIVVIGGGYSGLMAAGRLAYHLRGEAASITLVNGTSHFVQRIRLHQLAAGQEPARLSLREMLDPSGITFRQGWVTRLDVQAKQVMLETMVGEQVITYDYLIYAPGSFVDTDAVPGIRDHALSLNSEASALALREQLAATVGRAGRLLVCGGGLTGIEAAAELAEAFPGLRVTLVTRDRFGEQLSEQGRRYLRRQFERLGITVRDQTAVREITAAEVRVEGDSLAYDACLWAGAFRVPALGREAGLKVNTLDQVLTDDHLRALGQPDIYAIGDAADISAAIGTPIRMACATALPMGMYVGSELADRLRGRATRPYSFTYAIRCISLGRRAGLVQVVDQDDRPQERIIGGRMGALVKEMICRYTLWQVQHPGRVFLPRRRSRQAGHQPAVRVGV